MTWQAVPWLCRTALAVAGGLVENAAFFRGQLNARHCEDTVGSDILHSGRLGVVQMNRTMRLSADSALGSAYCAGDSR